MTARELRGWWYYSMLEPFGPLVEDERAALPAVTIANVHRDKKKKRTAFVVADLIDRPKLGSEIVSNPGKVPLGAKPGKTAGQMLRFVEGLFLGKQAEKLGTKDYRKNRPRYDTPSKGQIPIQHGTPNPVVMR